MKSIFISALLTLLAVVVLLSPSKVNAGYQGLVSISGNVKYTDGSPVANAVFTVTGYTDIPYVRSDLKGNYKTWRPGKYTYAMTMSTPLGKACTNTKTGVTSYSAFLKSNLQLNWSCPEN